MAIQFFVIFGCLALGEFVVWATGIKLPSSIIGMLFLTFFLKVGWVKLSWIEKLSQLLIANLGFFFVPPGVALILYLDVIQREWFPISYGNSGQYGTRFGCYGTDAPDDYQA
ncbi:CidA/LrgA family protein [Prevotella histicola]